MGLIQLVPLGLAIALLLGFDPTEAKDSSWRNVKHQTVRLEHATPDHFVRDFQSLFSGYGLHVQKALEAKAIALTGPEEQHRFGLGLMLISTMDVDDRFLESLRTHLEHYNYAHMYSLAQLVERVDRFLEGEKALERLRRWARLPLPPRSMHGCGGDAWDEWRSRWTTCE
jgi:hypothetical protein